MSVYRQARTSANACPRCMDPLGAAGVAGVRFCERCGGVFADVPTSKRIFDSLDRQLLAIGFDAAQGKEKPRDDGHAITCPECQLQMVKNRIDGASCVVDACPAHGTWFDTNEMVDVMRALDRARRKGIVLTGDRPSMPVNLATTPERARTVGEQFVDLVRDWIEPGKR
ncbi:MAG: hypothetical protein KIT84_00665 [Labilithrix sp.]|nr:hypothetical protein [Labilithrix sp.]MCW5809495.1 hypothetical protein [Labilithrix sp.]